MDGHTSGPCRRLYVVFRSTVLIALVSFSIPTRIQFTYICFAFAGTKASPNVSRVTFTRRTTLVVIFNSGFRTSRNHRRRIKKQTVHAISDFFRFSSLLLTINASSDPRRITLHIRRLYRTVYLLTYVSLMSYSKFARAHNFIRRVFRFVKGTRIKRNVK